MDVAAVVLFDGVAFSAMNVVPSAVASNCSVLLEAFALDVKVTPPTFALIGKIRHAFVTAHVEPAALSVAVTESCAGKQTGREHQRSKRTKTPKTDIFSCPSFSVRSNLF